jgi:hypothetical protein
MAEDDEWKFSLEDLEDDGTDATDPGADETGEGDGDGADDEEPGSFLGGDDDPEPGTPTLEGTAFVLLGAAVTVIVLLSMFGVL